MLIKGPKAPKLIRMSDVEMKEMSWLWHPYIPAASASMLFGPGGMGKSHIAVDIAARVTTGRPFPGDTKGLVPQNVLMMSAEDELDRVLGPRLVKAGADLSKILAPAKTFTLDRQGLEFVDDYISAASVGIVFIDPVVAYIGGKVDINRANETRMFTGGLHLLAMNSGVPIVIVHHSRKGTEGADWERAMGSVDFNNAVRSVMYTTLAPNGDHIMKHAKANYSALGPTLGYEFGDNGFQWTGEYEEDGTKPTTKAGKKKDIAEELRAKLKNGPLPAVQIEAWATAKGYNHRTLVRAKTGVAESYLISKDGKMSWFWRLIDEQADVPVMGSQWGDTKSRVEREIVARTEERTRRIDVEVDETGSIDDLMDKVLQ